MTFQELAIGRAFPYRHNMDIHQRAILRRMVKLARVARKHSVKV